MKKNNNLSLSIMYHHLIIIILYIFIFSTAAYTDSIPPGNALSCMHKNEILLKNPTSGLLHNLTNYVTVEFWSYGRDDIQAYNSDNEIIRADDVNGNVLLGVCLPRMNASNPSSAKVIFQTGVASIEKEVRQQDYMKRWNHWAFVQNGAATSMTMYLNGKYFYHKDGLGMDARGHSMANFRIANYYVGYLEELRIWNSARTEQEIRDNMNNFNISPTHRDLIIYCKFDRIDYTFIKNYATNAISYGDNPGFTVTKNDNYYIEGYTPTEPSLVQIKPLGSYAYYDQNNKILENDTNSAVTRLITDSQLSLITEVAMIIEHDFAGSRSSGFLENIGNPSYATGKHWMKKDERVSDISIDVYVPHDFKIDTRYVLDSYTIVNASGVTRVPMRPLPDIANPTYTLSAQTLSGWIKVIFKWKTQHSVEIRAVPSLPISESDKISLSVLRNPNQHIQSGQTGTGKWWYDKGTILQSEAFNLTNPCPRLCIGFFDTSDPTNSTVNNLTIKRIPDDTNSGLTEGASLVWKYETPTYKEQVTIGNPLSLRNVTQAHRSFIDLSREPTVQSNQNNEKLYYWDDAEKKLYPLIGSRTFFIEWHSNPGTNCNMNIVSEVSTSWSTSMKKTQYYHIANTPPVILDPDPNDDISFNSLLYTEGDGSVSQNKEFSASKNGNSVLLFDRIKPEIKDNPPKSLVAYYDFDQDSGTTLQDKSGNGNHGVISNSTASHWVTSLSGMNNALNFSGNVYVDISSGDYSSITNQFTIEFWAKGDNSLPKESMVFDARGDIHAKIILNASLPSSNEYVYFFAGEGLLHSGIAKKAIAIEYKNTWNHWAFVKNATQGTMKIYLNGNLWHSETGHNTMIAGSLIENFKIGKFAYDQYTSYYTGLIDEFRIWNIARKQEEIQSDVNLKDVNIIAHYNFDQQAGLLLPDISGNNNDGTLSTAMKDNDWGASTSFLNNALNFADPLNDKYVDISNCDFSSITEDITIDFWTGDLSLSYDTQNTIIDTLNTQNSTGFKIEFLDSENVQFIIGSHQPVIANISDSEFKYGWNYWVFTQDSTTHKINIYLNGYSLLLNNNPGNGDEITNLYSGQAYSGQNPINGTQITRVRIGKGFPGKIDELRIWNIARSHTDILKYYNDGYSPLRIVYTKSLNSTYTIDMSVTVGKEITSKLHDNRTPHNGYIYWVNSPYNANTYDRNTMQGEIFPVNVYQPNNRSRIGNNQDLYSHDNIEVVWYKVKDKIAWPYIAMNYMVLWPDYPATESKRIVIASQLGSEGKDKNGNDQQFPDKNGSMQNYLDPARYKNITIYNQPDQSKPGYNPNEEHAIIAPSYRHAKASPRTFAAFALRNDLNTTSLQTSSSSNYTTSEPFVLIQYLDQLTGKHGMATFKVEKSDPTYGYDFSYDMEAANPIVPPYPLNLVIGATPPSEIFGKNGGSNTSGQICYWKDHKGASWAVSGFGNTIGIQSVNRLSP
ncbi:conserved hypothetical protein, secreted, partial [Candidatus Magnetomorum sp. HK-1]